MKVKAFFHKLFPEHSRVPLLTVISLHFVFYCIPLFIVRNAHHYDLSLPVDVKIPFLSFFILFYVGAYLQWGVTYVFHFAKSREACVRLAAADIISKFIAAFFFVLLPTTMVQPALGKGFFDFCVGIIYFFDEPVNLFPSLHCVVSWLCFRSAFAMRRELSRAYVWGQFAFSLLVFASTVFIKQHVFIDIIGGVVLAEGVWLLTSLLPAEAAFSSLEAFLRRKNDQEIPNEQNRTE